METGKLEILSPAGAWDEAERQMDYDREDWSGWNGNRFVKKHGRRA